MILVTVGAQMPFDRMTRAIDAWAAERGRTDIFAQIGTTDFVPRAIEWTPFLEPEEFKARVRDADILVAHAGMGSIISALEAGKPILVMPRRGDLRETRNDHQVATAERFLEMGRVSVAFDEEELKTKLDMLDSMRASGAISPWASPELIAGIRSFINTDRATPPRS
ncbi:MAG: glycosyltransferase [Phycisphaerales bacterium JB041]